MNDWETMRPDALNWEEPETTDLDDVSFLYNIEGGDDE